MNHGTPGGNRLDFTKPPKPWAFTPAERYVTYAQTASSTGRPISEVPAMLRPGMAPVRLKARMPKKTVVSIAA